MLVLRLNDRTGHVCLHHPVSHNDVRDLSESGAIGGIDIVESSSLSISSVHLSWISAISDFNRSSTSSRDQLSRAALRFATARIR